MSTPEKARFCTDRILFRDQQRLQRTAEARQGSGAAGRTHVRILPLSETVHQSNPQLRALSTDSRLLTRVPHRSVGWQAATAPTASSAVDRMDLTERYAARREAASRMNRDPRGAHVTSRGRTGSTPPTGTGS